MAAESSGDPETEKEENWLRRQWRRVGSIRRRDVVIAQVGHGARNVVIGTRNIQINVSGRNLTLPVLVIPVLLLVIIGFLVYPVLEPLWNPAQMTGQFRIAVAQFGEMDQTGRVKATENGRVLSTWLFEGLLDEYLQNADVELANAIEIWHDSRTDTPQNFKFGIISGDSEEARKAAASRLADRIGAHMVIYGNLITDATSSGLDLEFYLSPLVNDETAAIIGSHRLGRLLPLPVVFDTSDPVMNVAVGERLKARSDALFWLTIGLTHQLLGRSDDALETFLRAEEELVDWPDSDGKEILFFFTGREHFFLGHIDEAEESFRRALHIDPHYGRAQVALGSIYQQRAEDVVPEERLDEPGHAALAVDHHRKGLELALAAEDPLLEAVARVALAKSYRLLGETYDFLDDLGEANRQYDLAIAEVDKATTLLDGTVQYRILAQAFETQGAAYLQQGLVLSSQQQSEQSRARLEKARTAYQHCIDQGDKAPFDEILQKDVIGRNCQRLYDRTLEFLQGLEEG